MKIRSTLAVLALVLAAAACGKKSETVTMNTDAGKIAVAASQGMALPADFPKDVPLMKDAVVNAVMGSTEQGSLMVFTHSDAPLPDVVAFYQENLKSQGWKTGSMTNTGEGSIMTVKKDGRDMLLTLAKDGKGTSVQVSLPNHKG